MHLNQITLNSPTQCRARHTCTGRWTGRRSRYHRRRHRWRCRPGPPPCCYVCVCVSVCVCERERATCCQQATTATKIPFFLHLPPPPPPSHLTVREREREREREAHERSPGTYRARPDQIHHTSESVFNHEHPKSSRTCSESGFKFDLTPLIRLRSGKCTHGFWCAGVGGKVWTSDLWV